MGSLTLRGPALAAYLSFHPAFVPFLARGIHSSCECDVCYSPEIFPAWGSISALRNPVSPSSWPCRLSGLTECFGYNM